MTNWRKYTLLIFVSILLIACIPSMALAKSIYLAAEHHQSLFDAWNVNPDGTVTKQATYQLQYATDPAGIAIDSDSEVIFITSEFSPGVEIVDPVNLVYLGVSSGPSDLAGIDVDDENDIVYTVERMTDNLHILKWDPSTNTLTSLAQINLPGCNQAMGIALDELRNTLWVADTAAGIVRAYEVGVWTEDLSRSFSPSHKPVDVAVDRIRNCVYTVSITGGATVPSGTGSNLLSKWDVLTATETTYNMGFGGVGLAVDEITGFVYVTGYQSPQVDEDYFEITGLDSTPVDIEVISADFPWAVGLLDSSGGVIQYAVDPALGMGYPVKFSGVIPDSGAIRFNVFDVYQGGGTYQIAVWPTGSDVPTTPQVNESEPNDNYAGRNILGSAGEIVINGQIGMTAPGGDNITVWDTSTTPFTLIQDTGPIGNPAGIVIGNVSYNPLNLAKNDIIQGEGVYIGMTFTYEITLDSPTFDLTNVTITDNLPAELDFVSATGGGVYDPITHTVVWDLGDVAAGTPIPTLYLDVKVNLNAQYVNTIYNNCTVDGDQIPPTTVQDYNPQDPSGEPGAPVLPAIPVAVDIKPTSCPNPINLNSKGVLPVAILGSENFDVSQIDPSSVMVELDGNKVAPLRWSTNDVAAPYIPYLGKDCCMDCTTEGPDGYCDLTLKYNMQEVIATLGLDAFEDGQCVVLTLTGMLKEEFGNTAIVGEDVIRIIKK